MGVWVAGIWATPGSGVLVSVINTGSVVTRVGTGVALAGVVASGVGPTVREGAGVEVAAGAGEDVRVGVWVDVGGGVAVNVGVAEGVKKGVCSMNTTGSETGTTA